MTAAKTLVDVRNVFVEKQGTMILHDVSMAIGQGQIITLIGPNGSGKTTLARAILSRLKVTNGTIFRDSSLRCGYMPQKISIDPTLPMTVKRFLQLSITPEGFSVSDALDYVQAKKLLNRPLVGLSGGEMQRILLAKAIMTRPNLLVLDEPVQGVDVKGQSELYKLIINLRNELNCAILLISHDLHLVLASSDEVICLNKHVCCSGTPTVVSQDPSYRALFEEAGPTPAGVVPYTHKHDHDHDNAPDLGPNYSKRELDEQGM